MSPSLSLKTIFSYYHLNGAALFARSLAQMERDFNSSLNEEERSKYFSSVTASILMSVAALESKINEVYLFAIDRNPHVFQGVEAWIIDTLHELWDTIEEKPILTKYQVALTVCKKVKFDKGQNPYQDAHRLVTLRNALVHYKPEWDTALNEHKRLELYLSNRFSLSPFSHVTDAFFPKRCIGHGCASWAVKTVIKFIDEFYQRLGIHETYITYDNLQTE